VCALDDVDQLQDGVEGEQDQAEPDPDLASQGRVLGHAFAGEVAEANDHAALPLGIAGLRCLGGRIAAARAFGGAGRDGLAAFGAGDRGLSGGTVWHGDLKEGDAGQRQWPARQRCMQG